MDGPAAHMGGMQTMKAASCFQTIKFAENGSWRAYLGLRGNARKIEHQAARKLWPAHCRAAALQLACAQPLARPLSRFLLNRVPLCCTLTRSRGWPRLRMLKVAPR